MAVLPAEARPQVAVALPRVVEALRAAGRPAAAGCRAGEGRRGQLPQIRGPAASRDEDHFPGTIRTRTPGEETLLRIPSAETRFRLSRNPIRRSHTCW